MGFPRSERAIKRKRGNGEEIRSVSKKARGGKQHLNIYLIAINIQISCIPKQ